MTKDKPFIAPDSRLDAEVQLKLTPERHESIARSWAPEEANARHRRQRSETLITETAIDIIGTEKLTPQDVRALAGSAACLKKEDVALDKVRAAVEIEKLKARTRLKVERLRARARLQLQRERQQFRLDRIDEIQKNWLKRELLRQKNRKDLESKRADGRQKLEDKKARHRFRLTRLKINSAEKLAAARSETRREATASAARLRAQASGLDNDPYPPGARYGRDPKTGRPYTRAEFMKHLRYAVYDIYGLNLPGETSLDGTARDPDTYADRIDADGEYIETPEEQAERKRQELIQIQRIDPHYRPFESLKPEYVAPVSNSPERVAAVHPQRPGDRCDLHEPQEYVAQVEEHRSPADPLKSQISNLPETTDTSQSEPSTANRRSAEANPQNPPSPSSTDHSDCSGNQCPA